MQTIQFEAELQNGTVKLPSIYHNRSEGKKVEVILLNIEEGDNMPHLTDLSEYAGIINLNEEPNDFQKRMRDEWD